MFAFLFCFLVNSWGNCPERSLVVTLGRREQAALGGRFGWNRVVHPVLWAILLCWRMVLLLCVPHGLPPFPTLGSCPQGCSGRCHSIASVSLAIPTVFEHGICFWIWKRRKQNILTRYTTDSFLHGSIWVSVWDLKLVYIQVLQLCQFLLLYIAQYVHFLTCLLLLNYMSFCGSC